MTLPRCPHGACGGYLFSEIAADGWRTVACLSCGRVVAEHPPARVAAMAAETARVRALPLAGPGRPKGLMTPAIAGALAKADAARRITREAAG